MIKNQNDQSFSFGRVQLVHFAINLLLSWMFSSVSLPGGPGGGNAGDGSPDPAPATLISTGNPDIIRRWLKALLLEDHDPAVRREMCLGLHKMCLGTTPSGTRNGLPTIAPLLGVLLEFLEQALSMKPGTYAHDCASKF